MTTTTQVRALLRRHRIHLILMAAMAATAGALAFALSGGQRWEYDEAAHRRVAEAVHGDIADWPTYRDVWRHDVCRGTEDLGLLTAVWLDNGSSAADIELNIKYACPDRLNELPHRLLD